MVDHMYPYATRTFRELLNTSKNTTPNLKHMSKKFMKNKNSAHIMTKEASVDKSFLLEARCCFFFCTKNSKYLIMMKKTMQSQMKAVNLPKGTSTLIAYWDTLT